MPAPVRGLLACLQVLDGARDGSYNLVNY